MECRYPAEVFQHMIRQRRPALGQQHVHVTGAGEIRDAMIDI
jgi:hypothetical protein